MADNYWRDLLRGRAGEGAPGAHHGGDDPNNGLDGDPHPGIAGWDDTQAQAAVDAYQQKSDNAVAAAAAAMPAALHPMAFDGDARAGNLYSGGFVPVINYGWANQGNAGLQASANPYAGYSTGERQLDQGISTLYGKPATPPGGDGGGGTTPPAGSATPPPAADPGSGAATPATPAGDGGAGEHTGGGGLGPGGGSTHTENALQRFLYGM